MPSNWFNESFESSKLSGKSYLDIQKVNRLRNQCSETLNLIKKFEENQRIFLLKTFLHFNLVKLFETNQNIDQRIEDQKTLLFQSKTTFSKILHEKGELLVDLEVTISFFRLNERISLNKWMNKTVHAHCSMNFLQQCPFFPNYDKIWLI